MLNQTNYTKIRHPYHLVESSPYALCTSLSLSVLMLGAILSFAELYYYSVMSYVGLTCLVVCLSLWCNDMVHEGSYQGCHTTKVQSGLSLGFILFICSEVAVFASVF
jgi:hypothetical protein